SFTKVLMGIHHHRIAYPGYDFNQAGGPAMLPQRTDGDGRRDKVQEITGEIPVSRDLREARGD
ncbi:MAG TPA: hypothetical protein VG778_10160, partial [Blastocatellia bacterium]|nr:hypothetical protein [Blastocatellia bacterium]